MATTDDIANMVFSRSGADYITGQNIPVDGGYVYMTEIQVAYI